MEENKYTDLDKLFQNRIDAGTQKKSAWNTPPDSVFGKAMHNIEQEKRKKRRVFFFWFFGVLAMLTLTTTVIYNSYKINKLDQEIDEIAKNQVHISPTNNSANLDYINLDKKAYKAEDKILLDNEVEKVIPVLTDQIKTDKSRRSNNNIKNDGSAIILSHNIDQEEPGDINVNRDEDLELFKEESKVVSNEAILNKINSSELLNKLESEIPLINYTRETANLSLSYSSIGSSQKVQKLISFSLYGGLNYSSFSMSGVARMSKILTRYDKWYPGYDIGISLGQKISKKWDIDYQINLHNINNQSLFNGAMLFDENMMTTDANGNMMYNPDIGLESPLGTFNRSVNIKMNGINISDQDELVAKSDISNQINVLSLKVAPKFIFVESTKSNIFITGGLGLNYISRMNQEMDTKVYHNEKMIFEDNFNINSMEKIQSIYGSVFFGAGFRYYLSKHLFIESQLNFGRSLNSIRRDENSLNIKTHFNDFGSALSIGYRF